MGKASSRGVPNVHSEYCCFQVEEVADRLDTARWQYPLLPFLIPPVSATSTFIPLRFRSSSNPRQRHVPPSSISSQPKLLAQSPFERSSEQI
jgi:hypothetical protein